MSLADELDAVFAAQAAKAAQHKPAVPLDVLEHCHSGQREAVGDDTLLQCWVTARRAGKTRGLIYRMLRAALSRENVNVLYLTTTIKRGVDTVWHELLLIARELGLEVEANHTRHCARLGNGSRIWVSGCETRREADEWRGVLPRTALVCIDEAQDWGSDLLLYTYSAVIVPSLVDIVGAFVVAGTPGSPRGFFWEMHNRQNVGQHSWPMSANPHIGDPRELIRQACEVRGCDETDPSIRREFFGEFVADEQRQIFALRPETMIPALPTGVWSYVIGADFGAVDATAVVVWGWLADNPRVYLIETQAKRGLSASAQVALVKEVAQRRERGLVGIVGDPGGGGKAIIIDLRQEHMIPMEPAEKSGKASACRLLGDGLRTGKVLIPESEKAFANTLLIPEWDPEAIGDVVKGHMPDVVDAAIYGYRKVTALNHERDKPKDERPQWQIDQEKELDRLAEQQQREEFYLREMGLMR
jgi:hypothetical protein